MDRLQKSLIKRDLEEKIVLLTGPRQVGKTTLAKSLADSWPKLKYLNYDAAADRREILAEAWDRNSDIVVLDEVHKLKKWKSKIKGIYDVESIPPRLLLTGSARMDVYRRGGDSLAGRAYLHRLYPFSIAELKSSDNPQKIAEHLMRFGGFPEPYLSQSETKAKRWRNQIFERVIRQDVQDLEPVKDIQSLLLLVDLLRARVGSTISYTALAGNLQVSPHTIKRWVQILANMYVIFLVTPYVKNVARSILKEPKVYFYDVGAVLGDLGARFENLVAVSLLKYLHFLEDSEGERVALHYVRDRNKREVDFLCVRDSKIEFLIEAKLKESNISKSLHYFKQRLKPKNVVQLVYELKHDRTHQGIDLKVAANWLAELEI